MLPGAAGQWNPEQLPQHPIVVIFVRRTKIRDRSVPLANANAPGEFSWMNIELGD
jgi:hypothetical protein